MARKAKAAVRASSFDEQCFAEYYYLVKLIARQYKKMLPPQVQLDDLLTYGAMGLVRAIELRDDSKGSFKEYVRIKIRGAIKDGIRRLHWFPWSYRTGERVIVQKLPKEVPDPYDLEEIMDQKLEQEKIQRVMEQLPEKFRRVLELYYWEQKDMREIGSICNRCESWTSHTLKEARKRFYKKYQLINFVR